MTLNLSLGYLNKNIFYFLILIGIMSEILLKKIIRPKKYMIKIKPLMFFILKKFYEGDFNFHLAK